MVEQGRALKAELPENVIIKIPCTPEGLAATKILTADGIKTNVTLIFSASQALMAAKVVQHMYLHLLEESMILERMECR